MFSSDVTEQLIYFFRLMRNRLAENVSGSYFTNVSFLALYWTAMFDRFYLPLALASHWLAKFARLTRTIWSFERWPILRCKPINFLWGNYCIFHMWLVMVAKRWIKFSYWHTFHSSNKGFLFFKEQRRSLWKFEDLLFICGWDLGELWKKSNRIVVEIMQICKWDLSKLWMRSWRIVDAT